MEFVLIQRVLLVNYEQAADSFNNQFRLVATFDNGAIARIYFGRQAIFCVLQK